jgi:ParB family transcriptional regulator, chromosome partitioning protein
VAITHRLALAVCYENWSYGMPSVVSVVLEKGLGSIKHHGPTIEQSVADKLLWKTLDLWQHKLPGDSGQLWDWLLSQDQGNILDILALCTAYTIHAVQMPHYADPERISAAQRLATSLNLDMAKWWQATAETYFSRVRREQIVEALTEAGVAESLDPGKLKKAELAAEAAKRLDGSRWLPRLLR